MTRRGVAGFSMLAYGLALVLPCVEGNLLGGSGGANTNGFGCLFVGLFAFTIPMAWLYSIFPLVANLGIFGLWISAFRYKEPGPSRGWSVVAFVFASIAYLSWLGIPMMFGVIFWGASALLAALAFVMAPEIRASAETITG